MKTWHAWILGVGIILASVGSCTVQTMTGSATSETYAEATANIKKGVDTIKNGNTQATETPSEE